jgi:hypothetical protein
MSRLPLKLEAQQQRGQISQVQRVQFRKPRIRFRCVNTMINPVKKC